MKVHALKTLLKPNPRYNHNQIRKRTKKEAISNFAFETASFKNGWKMGFEPTTPRTTI